MAGPKAASRSVETTGAESDLSRVQASRFRWFVLGLVALVMMVESLQRASLGVAGKVIQDEFHLSTQLMGWILSAFAMGQTVFQIPWGYAGDRYGPHKVLTLAVLCSAVSTLAIGFTPHAATLGLLGVAAFLITWRVTAGMGMAAGPSNCNKVVAQWMAPSERGLGTSAIPVGSGIGAALAPILTTLTMQRWGWRFSYFLFAAIAVAVALVWYVFSTSRPEEHPRVNSGELRLIRGVAAEQIDSARLENKPQERLSWSWMLKSRSLWALSLSFSCQQYAIMVFPTWFFIYLVRARGLSLTRAGFWGATPFLCMILFSPLGGRISDFAIHKFGKALGRRSTVWVGMGCSAIMLWEGSRIANNLAAISFLAGAAGLNYFALTGFWATCIDLAPNHTASVSSLMNTTGSFGGWVAPIATAFVITHWGWQQAIASVALITAMCGLLWFFVDATQNIEQTRGGLGDGILTKP